MSDYPHQIRNAAKIVASLRQHGVAGDWSETGTGKTFTALRTIREAPAPTLVVTPKIVTTAWRRAAAATSTECSTSHWDILRYGTTPFGWWEARKRGSPFWTRVDSRVEHESGPLRDARAALLERLVATGCGGPEAVALVKAAFTYADNVIELKKLEAFPDVRAAAAGFIEGLKVYETSSNFWRFRWHAEIGRIYFDEFHRARGSKSQLAAMVRAARDQRKEIVMLTATPAADPTEMRALGYVCRWFEEWSDWHNWCLANGCWKPMFGGLKFLSSPGTTDVVIERLRAAMLAIGVKTTLREVMPENAQLVHPTLLDLGPDATEKVSLLLPRAEQLLETIRGKRATAPNALAEYNAIRQELEILRVPAMVELAKSKREAGCRVLIFCQYRETVNAFSQLLGGAPVIHGDVTPKRREEIMRKVHAGEYQQVVLQSQAGGESISLQDLTGDSPVVSLVSVPDSAYSLIQIAGRSDRLGSRSVPILLPIFAAGTIEEKRWAKVSRKAQNIKDLTDADLTGS